MRSARRRRTLTVALAALLVALLGAVSIWGPRALGFALAGAVELGALALLGTSGWLLFQPQHPRARKLSEVLWLGVLPTWGFALNAALPANDMCADQNRLLALPQACPFYGAYALTVVAYIFARGGSDGGKAEPWIRAGLAFGIVQLALLTLQFNWFGLEMGLLISPICCPLLAPGVLLVLYARTLSARTTSPVPPPRLATATTAGFATVYVVLHRLWLGTWLGAMEVFTRTSIPSKGLFSTLTPPPADCHYLCTVAAQGSPWLVRPLRWGVRRGQPIVVNRQLAIANAFEDLLHERWPRFGAWARRTYDWWALPVSRWLCRRWMANLVYLVMLPCQLGFWLALRTLDRGDPEARVDRMYRP